MSPLSRLSGITFQDLPAGPFISNVGDLRRYRISCNAVAGARIRIVGPTGVGKSQIGQVLVGLASPDQSQAHHVWLADTAITQWNSAQAATLTALVPPAPDHLFSCLGATLKDELEFAFAFLDRDIDSLLINDIVRNLELTHLIGRDPLTFSGGEKVRAAIGLCLAKLPQLRLLVLDDVYPELDPVSEALIHKYLASVRRSTGLTVVELHSHAPAVSEPEDLWYFITPTAVISGGLDATWIPLKSEERYLLPAAAKLAAEIESNTSVRYKSCPQSAVEIAEPFSAHTMDLGAPSLSPKSMAHESPDIAIRINSLCFAYTNENHFRLGPMTHEFTRGSVTALLGRNGAGKTTLLRCLAGLYTGWTGKIAFCPQGPTTSTPLHVWARTALYCFQNPDDQIFYPTVSQELLATANNFQQDSAIAHQRLIDISEALGLTPYLAQSPFDLPRPLRRLITIASALIAAPPILLLDEPTASLDPLQVEALIPLLKAFVQNGGTIIAISHDLDFTAEIADEVLVLHEGHIKADQSLDAPDFSWPDGFCPIVAAVAQKLNLPSQLHRRAQLFSYLHDWYRRRSSTLK